VTVYCSFVFDISLFIVVFRVDFDLDEDVACVFEVLDNGLYGFFTYSQLPLGVFDEDFNNFNRMLFLQDLKGLVVGCMLLGRIWSNFSEFDPKFGLKRRLGLLNTADSLELILTLLGHKGHFGLPNGLLKVLGEKIKHHVSNFFALFEEIVFPSGAEV
jgi:hypothetical protein